MLKLGLPFPFFISKNPFEIPISRTFLAKFSIFSYISLKIDYFELGDDYDVTVTSYLGCWYLFWYLYGKRRTLYNMVQVRCIPLPWYWSDVLQKRLGKTRVNITTQKQFCTNDNSKVFFTIKISLFINFFAP